MVIDFVRIMARAISQYQIVKGGWSYNLMGGGKWNLLGWWNKLELLKIYNILFTSEIWGYTDEGIIMMIKNDTVNNWNIHSKYNFAAMICVDVAISCYNNQSRIMSIANMVKQRNYYQELLVLDISTQMILSNKAANSAG